MISIGMTGMIGLLAAAVLFFVLVWRTFVSRPSDIRNFDSGPREDD